MLYYLRIWGNEKVKSHQGMKVLKNNNKYMLALCI